MTREEWQRLSWMKIIENRKARDSRRRGNCKALDEIGVGHVPLDQVRSHDLSYDDAGNLRSGVAEAGALTDEAGKLLRCDCPQRS